MAAIIDDIIIALAITAATTAATAALAPEAEIPNYGAASSAAQQAEFDTLPARRKLERLAALGQQGVVEGQKKKGKETAKFVELYDEPYYNPIGEYSGQRKTKLVPYVEEEWLPGGKYRQLGYEGPPKIVDKQVPVTGRVEHGVDFRGFGDAEVAGQMADKMAQIELDLQKEFGPKFAEQAKRMQELADPEGAEARRLLYDEIVKDLDAAEKVDRPVATELERQLIEEMALGGKLNTDAKRQLVDAAVGRTMSGDDSNYSGIIEGSETGVDALSRLRSRQQKGISFLTSGTSPEDVSYRRNLQGMANMADFLQGRSPQAQFSQLSGAQQGPAPSVRGQPLPGYSQQNVAAGTNQAVQNYASQGQQVNPWFAGLNVALQGIGTAGTLRNI